MAFLNPITATAGRPDQAQAIEIVSVGYVSRSGDYVDHSGAKPANINNQRLPWTFWTYLVEGVKQFGIGPGIRRMVMMLKTDPAGGSLWEVENSHAQQFNDGPNDLSRRKLQ